MFDGLLKSKFYAKCKSDIKLIRTRVDLIKKKRSAMQKYLRNDVADLLRNGLDINAYGRAEGLLAEMNRTYCYEFVDQCCVHVLNYLGPMNKQRECPEECREAVSSLMFAAARFADLPELRELRTVFSEKYGGSLDLFVNKQFVEKLKSGLPSKDLKLELLQEIASESGIEWNSKALNNQLCNAPAAQKDFDKEINNKGYNWHDNMHDSVQTKGGGGGYEFKNMNGSIAPNRKEEHTHHGQKEEAIKTEDRLPKKKEAINVEDRSPAKNEAIGIQDRLRWNKEAVVPVRDDIVPQVIKRPHEVPPIKDIQVDSNGRREKKKEITSLRSVPKEDEHDEKLPKFSSLPPPYTKREVEKAEEQHEEKLLKYRSIPPPYTKHEVKKTESSLRDETGDIADDEKTHDENDHIPKPKPMPKSVRRRNLKPLPGHEKASSSDGNEREHLKDINKETAAQGQRILKFFDKGSYNEEDEEEKMMDKLLRHYSKKRDPHEKVKSGALLKPPPHLDPTDSNKGTGHKNRDGPNRTSSLPSDLTSPPETSRRHVRANSFHPDNNVHVHPKLPDYDDFVARLAALRGK